MAVALAVVALVLALNAPEVEDDVVEDVAVEPPWVEPSERTMAMVDEAVRRYEAEGLGGNC